MQSLHKSVVACTASLAMCAALALAAVPPAQAAAPDAATTAVTGLFGRLATEFLPQVASSTALSRQLPTLAVTPAESVDLKTAFADLFKTGGRLEDASSQADLGALAGYVDDADGGGWTFTASDSGSSLTVGFTHKVTRDAGLDIRDTDGTISLSSGDGIRVTGLLTGSFTFAYDATAGQASLTTPSMTIATTADLPSDTTMNAGLGILGVAVTGDGDSEADYHLESTVTTSWANPDNDAAGALAFDNPATATADDGELAAEGAGTGIVTATQVGTLAGRLVATPRANDRVAGLPSVGTTVTLSSSAAGASFEAPLVTAVVPDEAKPFLTMTPRDLAAALSQAASAVLGMQDAKDGGLPLMRGSIGNAVDAVGGIKQFLADQVPDADPDDKTPGMPKFASLQDLLVALDNASYDSGWTIDVLGDPADATDEDAARYDPTSKKVGFTLRATRGVSAPLELNILGAATSGTATYSATGLSVTGSSAHLPTGAELVGRKVTSGASYGTVAAVPTATTLTLTADGWVGGRPTNGSAFAVEAADPKTGAPEFADVLKATTGIATANAEVSTATVTPDVVLTLPMALDLSAPLTYAADSTKLDCNPDIGVESPCPFQQVDTSGLARVITSLPLAADRVLFRQSARTVLVADAEISSPVQIATSSGFLGLSISGDLKLTQGAGEHLQTLALTKGTAADPEYIPVPAFVEEVRQQAVRTSESTDDVFSQKLQGAVEATIDVSVNDSKDAFAAGEDSTELTLTGTVDKLADGIQGDDVTVVATDPARADLLRALNFEPDNPTSLFGGVREAFKSAGSDLTTMTGGGLDVPIPFVGSSVSQLIGAGASGGEGVKYAQVAGTAAIPATGTTPAVDAVPATTRLTDAKQTFTRAFIGRQIVVGSTTATIVDQGDHTLTLAPQLGTAPADDTPYLVENELLGAVHLLTATTPATLQDALAIAQSSLGNSSTIGFGLVDNDGAKLRLDLTWERKYAVSQPVSLDLGDQELGGASAGGELSLTASGTVKLRLLLPLTKAAMLDPIANTLVDETESKIDFGVKVDAGAAHIGASIGPVSVDLGTVAEPGSFKAGIGLKITGTTGEDTPSIADFFKSGFGVTVTNGGSCTTGVVICGKFPVYVSGVKPPGDDLTITSTLAAGESLTKVFSTTNTKVVLPSGLQKILDGEAFKFDSLAEGLQQYLFYSETALRTASNDGEMPVVGKDLQAGADFMGKAREKLDAMLAVADPTTVGGATTMLKAKLAEMGVVVDGSAGIDVNFTCTRKLEPPSPAPTATASNAAAADTTQYVYKVVSVYKDTKLVEHDSIPSDPTDPVATNASTLSAAKFNTVAWTKVDVASGYRVLRAVQAADGTVGTFTKVGTIANNTTVTFKDAGDTSDDGAYTAETKAYSRIPSGACESTTPVLQIEGVVVDLQLGQGKVGAKGCEDDLNADGTVGKLGRCLGGELPVDLGIPGLSLKTGDGGAVKGSVGWNLDLSIGLSRSRGFYVNTNKVPNQPEFRVGASLGLGGTANDGKADLAAQLSIIKVDADKNSATPEFVGQFGIDIKDDPKDGPTDFDLTVAEMKRLRVKDVIVVTVRAQVDINWHLAAGADAALPGISTDFRLTWAWGLTSGPPPPPTNKDDLKIAFNQVTLDTGKFFGKALNPYLKQVMDATKPLQPVIDTIFTPVPVISDLSKAAGGSEITIATLAEKFNTLPEGAKIQPFLKAIKLVKQLLTVKCDGDEDVCGVLIGSFELNKDRVATTTASAGSAKSMIDTKPVTEGGTYAPNKAADTQIADKDASKQLATPGTISKVKSLTAGLSIPVMEDPTILFELISGGDIPLVEFDSGPLSLGFQFQKSFGPIYAPPPVMMVIGGGASVTLRIAAGFDTYGIRRAIETGDGAQVLDSLYFKTVDNNGVPIPVVQFTGYLEAGASVSIGILEVGVVGGIKLTVGFYWNDPNGDGKFRLFEFGAAVANNPICLFNVGGELSLYIKIFVEIGFSPFSVSFDFTLVNIKLLDFSFKPNCTPPPPRLGGTQGGVLYIFAGKFGGAGPRGNAAWDADNKAETWAIRQVPEFTDEQGDTHEAAVEVRGIGLTESFSDKDGAITTVVLDGRTYSGNLTVSFTGGSGTTADAKKGAFTKTAVVFTGSGDDVIRTGEGDSWVDSGAGADNITTLDRADLDLPLSAATARVAGGPGPDVITVGNGNDTVTGDGSITVTEATRTVELAPDNASDPHNTSLVGALDVGSLKDSALTNVDTAKINGPDGNDGDDQIAAGLGAVHLSGNGGVDTIGTANDNPLADSDGIRAGSTGGSADKEALYRAHDSVLVGGAGGDILKSGSANDKVFTGSYATIGESDAGSGDADTDANTVNTGAGSDFVYGSNGLDFVTTASTPTQTATVFGGGANDVLTGGLGTDRIYGGPGDDYVVAAPATVGAPGAVDDALGKARDVAVLPGAGGSAKLLVGGTGSDRIYGSDGPSTIFGDTTVDACAVQSDPVSAQPGETTVSADAADLVLGGNGVDVVNAGGGNDWVYAAGADDRVCGNSGDDHLYAGDANDLVYGGSGDDQSYGEAGDDQAYGNDGSDAVYGGAGADRLQGNKGADWLDGGTEADVLLGGTSKAGTADGADVLLGAGGTDVLVGDNAQTDLAGGAPYPTDLGSSDATLGGDDYLVGGTENDREYGGLGDDTVFGGSGDDYAEGNPGTDTISGETGDDDLVGGSSELATSLFTGSEPGRPDAADHLFGGAGQDVITGDNARVTRGGTAHPVALGLGLTTTRGVDLADESSGSPTGVFGNDEIQGGSESDVVFAQRGNDDVSLGDAADYGEGGPGVDLVHGDAGDDDVVGGSFTPVGGAQPVVTGQPDGGDTLAGDAGQDVVLGDNGSLTRPVAPATGSPLTLNRVTAQRAIAPFDLGDSPVTGTSGADTITGDADNDVLLGQGGADSADGGSDADYVEGGQGSDLVLGGTDDDDVVGGSSAGSSTTPTGEVGQPDGADNVYGGTGSDLILGDNGLLTRPTTGRDWRTNRANAAQTALVPARGMTMHDLVGPAPLTANGSHSAGDAISGQDGVDVIFGQDGADAISGGGDDDYVEGDGGADGIHGDVALTEAEIITAPADAAWATPTVDASPATAGQDDIAGGWARQGYRDGDDTVHGDGSDDFVVADNGSIARVVDGTTDRVYTQRYGSLRSGSAKVRVAGGGAASTRFCPTTGATATSTCEVAGAFGSDAVFGDGGQDVLYGQDGADTIRGGDGDDDVYGELGADFLYGEAGEDAVLGDRGGIQNRYETGGRSTTTSLTMPPAVSFTSRLNGSVSREVDLLHDVNGTDFVGGATSAAMPLDGITFGGADRIRGGDGHDSIHAGAGDDLANGDTGGDAVFGDRGDDVMWGGAGKACAYTDAVCLADAGTTGEFIDHLAGGKGADVVDWRPRGAYGTGPALTGRTCSTSTLPVTTKKDGTTDPCSWFEMTERADDAVATPATLQNNQHHQGVDWVYGGWDRDVMQGDLSNNGPHNGDRLIDWSGVYNLWSHCNAAYGGFTDVRVPAPAVQDFLLAWAAGNGSGRPATGGSSADVATPGTSAFDELALVYTGDLSAHGAGSAYPTTPGHFDDANACAGY